MNVTKRKVRDLSIMAAGLFAATVAIGYVFGLPWWAAALSSLLLDWIAEGITVGLDALRKRDRRADMRRNYAPRATAPIVPDTFTLTPRMGGVVDMRETDESPDEWLRREYPHLVTDDTDKDH